MPFKRKNYINKQNEEQELDTDEQDTLQNTRKSQRLQGQEKKYTTSGKYVNTYGKKSSNKKTSKNNSNDNTTTKTSSTTSQHSNIPAIDIDSCTLPSPSQHSTSTPSKILSQNSNTSISDINYQTLSLQHSSINIDHQTSLLHCSTTPVIVSRSNTPIIDIVAPSTNEHNTPLDNISSDNNNTAVRVHVHQLSNDNYDNRERFEKQYESLLLKQGKQIRASYELQKKTFNSITLLQNQLKKQNNNDLSHKVFSDGYSAVCSQFFPRNMWPKFDEYKRELEKWLKKNHPNYLKEVGD